jgi:hypothetical protein
MALEVKDGVHRLRETLALSDVPGVTARKDPKGTAPQDLARKSSPRMLPRPHGNLRPGLENVRAPARHGTCRSAACGYVYPADKPPVVL